MTESYHEVCFLDRHDILRLSDISTKVRHSRVRSGKEIQGHKGVVKFDHNLAVERLNFSVESESLGVMPCRPI